jgi:hypothetical protein
MSKGVSEKVGQPAIAATISEEVMYNSNRLGSVVRSKSLIAA